MQSFLQFLIIGLGAGATYALFAQGAVLIYRGSGLVNFAQGAIGTFAAYIAFVELQDDRGWGTWPAIVVAVVAAGLASLAFQALVLRALRHAAAIVRVIATIGLLGLLQAIVLKRYGAANQPVEPYLPDDIYDWGGITVQQERLTIVAITVVVTVALWAWTRYTRVGLAINASAQNERAVQTLGWSPDRLAALTWTIGGMLGGFAAVLAAPLTGLSAATFTIVVTVAGLGAALLGGFLSFPLTLLGGLIIGVSEAMATLYGNDITDFLHQDLIAGLNRTPAFLVILLVVVVRGRGLPLRSHVAERLPRLGTGEINVRGVLLASAIVLALLFGVMDESWAQATYISVATGVMVLSIVVLTGYAGQISLAQWALAGIGALIAGRFVHADFPVELADRPRRPADDPGGPALRRPGAADPRREPRRGHPRPRVPRVGGGLRQPQLPGRGHRRRDPDRPGEAVRDGGRRRQPPSRLGGGQPRRLRAGGAAGRQPAAFAHRPAAHRRADQRARRRLARHLGVRREALRLRRLGGPGRRGRDPDRVPGPAHHLHRVQRLRLDQQPRLRRDRRPRLRARGGLRRAERDRRPRYPGHRGLDRPRGAVGSHPRVAARLRDPDRPPERHRRRRRRPRPGAVGEAPPGGATTGSASRCPEPRSSRWRGRRWPSRG